jgi:hypothetical protein
MANAIGMGGAAGSQQAVDLEGRPLKESDRQALVMEVTQDVCLDSVLDYKGVSQLGAKPSHNLMSIIPVDVKDGKRIALKVDHSISSDADEQLLLFLPFLRPVKLLSFLLRLSVKDPACNPKTLKMFANRPNMDFGDADSTTPATTVEVPLSPGRPFTKEETKEGLWEFVATVDRVKFAQTSFLTIFIESNHGAKATRLFGLTLVGREN